MATPPWLSLRFTALGAAGHGTAVEGVSDRVEATPGEWCEPLARHVPTNHAMPEATRSSFVQAPARAQMRHVAARAQNHQPGWLEPCSHNAWLSRSAVVDDSLRVVRGGRLAWTSREVRNDIEHAHGHPSKSCGCPTF